MPEINWENIDYADESEGPENCLRLGKERLIRAISAGSLLQDPVQFSDGSSSQDHGEAIKCPICNDFYVHFNGDSIWSSGKDNYETKCGLRGDCIRIPMVCECNDHQFFLTVGSHKGNLFVFTEK